MASLALRGERAIVWRESEIELCAVAGHRLDPIRSFAFRAGRPTSFSFASREDLVCWRDHDFSTCRMWTPSLGEVVLASKNADRDPVTGLRNRVAVGLIDADDQALVAIAVNAELSILDRHGTQLAKLEIGTPSAWISRGFATLPGGWVAMRGSLFGDPYDTVITLPLWQLLGDAEAVQRAIRRGIRDRSPKLSFGRGPGTSMVVLRDPEDEEPLEDRDEDTSDIWGLRGYYIRDLETGALVEQAPLDRIVEAGSIVANERVVAFEVPGGVEVLDRRDRSTRMIRGDLVALDPFGVRVGILGNDATLRVEGL